MVLSLWQSYCESSPGTFDEAPRWPPTLRPSQPTWTASPPEGNGSYRPHPPSPFYYYSARKLILILPSHGAWRVEGRRLS